MATQTQHFSLTKPDWEDRASISVLNANSDIIDAQMYDNEQSAANAIGNMAAEYDDTATYAVGDFCIYSEVLYKCVTAVTVAEAFDSTKWTQTTAAENFGSGGGGGSATLAGLNDVNLTSPTDGQVLTYDAANAEWVNGAGGGGNANERVLTKAEYEALTDAEKLNGTTYYINDAVPEGKEIQPVIYSFEEREVGVWTDGKPLYERTFYKRNTTQTFNDFIDFATIDDFAECISIEWTARRSAGGGLQYTGNGAAITEANLTYGILFRITSTGVLQYNIRNYGTDINDMWATVRYTKTTDTAGSGIWTTTGEYAHHYSTTEHAVGTWIDGSTIYQRTFEFSTVLSIEPSVFATTSISNSGMEKIINVEAISATGTRWQVGGACDTGSYVNLFNYRSNSTISIKYVTLQYTKTT